MKRIETAGLFVALLLLAALGAPGPAGAEERLKASLRGFQEVPAISTTGHGEFRAKISDDETSIEFVLTYSDLEGITSPATAPLFAHIHLGQRGVNGGVSIFLCGGGGKPACPPQPAMVTGTLDASGVVGPVGQGIAAGEFAELLHAIRSGVTYANVHTTRWPGGEIRGQIKR